jgi:hypothetical protein
MIVCELGEAEIEKSCAVVTTSETVTICVSDPLVPVIVRFELPPGVVAEVVTVSVELPLPVIEAGLNDAVAPVGKPLALKLTVPVKPFTAATDTV